MTKVAIVGSGATGFVAAHAVREASSRSQIHVFHGGPQPPPHALAGVDHRRWTRDDLASLHEEIRAQVGFKFPPPKSHFGETIPKHATRAGHTVWRSCAEGGLTRYWSGSLLPFTDDDLKQWGFGRSDFDEHYGWIADRVGLAAREDGLNRYFGRSFATRPAVTPTRLVEKLIAAVDRPAADGGGLIAGVNRVAIETRADHARRCVLCGGCFYGCFAQAVLNTAELDVAADSSATQNVHEKVIRARKVAAGYELETATSRYGPFDTVYCAAGCVGSSELVARSFLGGRADLTFVDNELFFFPLLYLGPSDTLVSEYLAIANALVGFLAEDGTRYAEAHVAPLPDLLMRFYLPARLDRLSSRLASWLRGRVLLVKLYLHSDTAPRLVVVPDGSGVRIEVAGEGGGTGQLSGLLRRLRRAIAGSGFWLPRGIPALRSTTSSHYAGGLHPGAEHAADRATGEIAPGFHVVDSSLMPFSPAQPLTFTSMANARRIVQTVMHG